MVTAVAPKLMRWTQGAYETMIFVLCLIRFPFGSTLGQTRRIVQSTLAGPQSDVGLPRQDPESPAKVNQAM